MQHRVAVRRGVCNDDRADDAIRAGAVIDDQILAQEVFRLSGDSSGDQVGTAPRGSVYDESDRPGGKSLRARSAATLSGRAAHDSQRDEERSENPNAHDSFSSSYGLAITVCCAPFLAMGIARAQPILRFNFNA